MEIKKLLDMVVNECKSIEDLVGDYKKFNSKSEFVGTLGMRVDQLTGLKKMVINELVAEKKVQLVGSQVHDLRSDDANKELDDINDEAKEMIDSAMSLLGKATSAAKKK